MAEGLTGNPRRWRVSKEFVGNPLEVIHILLTDTTLDRMREVGPDTYEALAAARRGRPCPGS